MNWLLDWMNFTRIDWGNRLWLDFKNTQWTNYVLISKFLYSIFIGVNICINILWITLFYNLAILPFILVKEYRI